MLLRRDNNNRFTKDDKYYSSFIVPTYGGYLFYRYSYLKGKFHGFNGFAGKILFFFFFNKIGQGLASSSKQFYRLNNREIV